MHAGVRRCARCGSVTVEHHELARHGRRRVLAFQLHHACTGRVEQQGDHDHHGGEDHREFRGGRPLIVRPKPAPKTLRHVPHGTGDVHAAHR